MKWDKAIKQIEKWLDEGGNVLVMYHRKWMPNDVHFDDVMGVVEYEYEGKKCKAINTFRDQLNEGSHIIDEVNVDFFFNTRINEELKNEVH